jgi:hypothetical protein
MSKPLPVWYEEGKAERERLVKVAQDNRDRIMQEFRAKYEVTPEDKERERIMRNAALDARMKGKKVEKGNVFSRFLSKASKGSTSLKSSVEVDVEEEDDLDDLTTTERWERFLSEEEKTTGFDLPGFFEVFPELKFKWPKWARRKDGSALKCTTDRDCPVPLACCSHPIIPGDSFCCSGFGNRIMSPAYVVEGYGPALDVPKSGKSAGGGDKENWRGQ